MFRKFIVPGFRRRWGALHYSERTEEWEEGAYVSTTKFAGRLLKNLREMKAMMLSREWQTMDDYEKANVIRTLGEIITLITVIILANVAIKMAGDDDDDHDKAWNFLAYQALRLRSEFLFFVSPMAAMQILRSPAASISVVENTFKLLSQVVGPGWDEYQQGPWKDHLKIEKTLIDLSIGVRQVYRLRNIEEQVTMMKSKVIRSQ